MTQINFYENGTGKYIKSWNWWDNLVPVVGDVVVLHFGDDNEHEVGYNVRMRVIDGANPGIVKLFVEKIEDREKLIEEHFGDIEVMKKMIDEAQDYLDKQSSSPQEKLLRTRVDELDLSIRTKNIMKANNLNTVADICRLHKYDWLRFRNGGKRTLDEIECFLQSNGLEWGMKI